MSPLQGALRGYYAGLARYGKPKPEQPDLDASPGCALMSEYGAAKGATDGQPD